MKRVLSQNAASGETATTWWSAADTIFLIDACSATSRQTDGDSVSHLRRLKDFGQALEPMRQRQFESDSVANISEADGSFRTFDG